MNLHRLGRAAAFVAGSIVGGLALAFVIVFLRPQLLQRPAAGPEPASATGAPSTLPAAAQDSHARSAAAPTAGTAGNSAGPGNAAGGAGAIRGNGGGASPRAVTESYAAAVMRAAPAVVNISTQRLVTEQISALGIRPDVRRPAAALPSSGGARARLRGDRRQRGPHHHQQPRNRKCRDDQRRARRRSRGACDRRGP